ncbi:MAG TPA: lipase family protein, partial [Vicinamibacterales bacterium]
MPLIAAPTKKLPDVDLKTQLVLLTHPEQNPTHYVPFEDAASFPFEAAAKPVSRVNAWWLAEAAWLSYGHSEEAIKNVYKTAAGLDAELVSVDGTEFTIATNGAFAIVAFRGTQPDDWEDVFSDLEWVPKPWDIGHVHRGFAKAFEAAWPALQERLQRLQKGCPVWFTGHSLGAALATLAAWRAGGAGICTFGSPLIGDQIFAGTFNSRFSAQSLRYVNDFDIVTRVPPEEFAFPLRFTHVDALRWIDRHGAIGNGPVPTDFFKDVIGAANARFML